MIAIGSQDSALLLKLKNTMKVEIENYRGWDISFDTDSETFYTQSNEYDRGETKRSFAAAKQYIDDFIKENLEFKPIWIESPASMYREHTKIKLIGIRKDKRFVYENEEGNKHQLSEHSEKDYIICNEANTVFYDQLAECRKRKAAIDEEMRAIEANLIRVGLSEIKAKYSI